MSRDGSRCHLGIGGSAHATTLGLKKRSGTTEAVISIALQILSKFIHCVRFQSVRVGNSGVRVLCRIKFIINDSALIVQRHQVSEVVRVRAATTKQLANSNMIDNLPVQVLRVKLALSDGLNSLVQKVDLKPAQN